MAAVKKEESPMPMEGGWEEEQLNASLQRLHMLHAKVCLWPVGSRREIETTTDY
jgi:hypothetical protein